MDWLQTAELEEIVGVLSIATNEPEEELEKRFKITDTASMSWVLRKLKALESAHNEDVRVFDEEVGRLTEWLGQQSHKSQLGKEFLTGLVEEYARGQHKEDPEWKGVKSPHGKVTYKTPKDKASYGDEDKLVEYLEANGFLQLIKTVKTPIKDDLKKLFPVKGSNLINTETGEVIPEISFVKQEPVLKITLEG
jgi:hypothetical protein